MTNDQYNDGKGRNMTIRKKRKPTQKEAMDALLVASLKYKDATKAIDDLRMYISHLEHQLYWTNVLKNPCYEAERMQKKW